MISYYYIVDNISSSDNGDLPVGPRVFIVPESEVFLVYENPIIPKDVLFIDDGEGPYCSISELKENSDIYQELLSVNRRRADKIFQDEFLIPFEKGQYAAYASVGSEQFENEVFDLLSHTVVGRVRKNHVSGIHYFDSTRMEIVEMVGFDPLTDVWQAIIKIYNPNSDKWVIKYDATTFFPEAWDYSKVLEECQYAHLNRIRVSETKWKGITMSGVLIMFIYNEFGKLKTAYPVCEEL